MTGPRRNSLVGDGHTCALSGKKVFRSPGDAERRRKVIRKRHGERLRVYRCRCGFWHLGH